MSYASLCSPVEVRSHVISLDPAHPPAQLIARGLAAVCRIQCEPIRVGSPQRATLAYLPNEPGALCGAFGRRVCKDGMVMPTFAPHGECVAWRLWMPEKIDGRDRLAPWKSSGWATKGAVFADGEGQRMLRGQSEPAAVLIAEGEPDFLTLCAVAEVLRKRGVCVAVLGVFAGAWCPDFAARIPKGALVFIATHHDAAGEGYAAAVRLDLPPEQRVYRLHAWQTGFVGDANDYWQAGFGGLRALAEGTASEEVSSAQLGNFELMPAPPTTERDRWTWSDSKGWIEREAWARRAAVASVPRGRQARVVEGDEEHGWRVARAFKCWACKLDCIVRAAQSKGGTHGGNGGWGGRALVLLRAAEGLEALAYCLNDKQRDYCAQARHELRGALATLKRAAETGARDAETKRARSLDLDNMQRKANREPLLEADVLRLILERDKRRNLRRVSTSTAPIPYRNASQGKGKTAGVEGANVHPHQTNVDPHQTQSFAGEVAAGVERSKIALNALSVALDAKFTEQEGVSSRCENTICAPYAAPLSTQRTKRAEVGNTTPPTPETKQHPSEGLFCAVVGASAAVEGEASTEPTANEEGSDKQRLNFDNGTARLCERYLPKDLLTDRVGEVWRTLTVKSDQGTGKTEALAALVWLAKVKRLRVLVLTHRQSLAWQLAARLGARCYLDEQGALVIRQGEVLVLSLDSIDNRLITRTAIESLCPELVIIDESEQVARHLFGKTIGEKLEGVAAKLRGVLRDAGRTVCADADAGMLTAHLLEWAGRGEGLTIQNDWHGWGFNVRHGNTVRLLKNRTKEGRLQLMHHAAAEVCALPPDAPPALVACTSREQATDTARYMADKLGFATLEAAAEAGAVLLITKDTKGTSDAARFLKNPNGELNRWRAIVYSPTLGTGFSIDKPVSRVFLMAATNNQGFITGADVVQLATRARKQLKPMMMWLDGKTFDNMPRTQDEAREQGEALLNNAAYGVEQACSIGEQFRGQFRMQLLQKAYGCGDSAKLYGFWLAVVSESGRTGWNLAQATLDVLKARGADVVEDEGGAALSSEVASDLRRQTKEDEVQGTLAAHKLAPDFDLTGLRQTHTPEAKRKERRALIERRLGEDVSEETARAEVYRGALKAGSLLAEVAALAAGGEVAKHRAQQVEAALSCPALVGTWRKQQPRAARILDVLKVAGLAGVLAAPPGSTITANMLTLDTPETLDALWVHACENRAALVAASLTPPKADCTEKQRRGQVLRWLRGILEQLGFVSDCHKASGAERKRKGAGAKARCYFLTAEAIAEARRWARCPFAGMCAAAEADAVSWHIGS